MRNKPKTMWELKAYESESNFVMSFTSKKKALDTITLWAGNASNPFDVREDFMGMNSVNKSEMIHLDYRNGNSVMMFLHRILVNNGSDLTLLGRN